MDIRHFINIILESQQWPETASAREVEDIVKSIHYDQGDFMEIISKKINRYQDYILKKIRLSSLIPDWNMDLNRAKEYAEMHTDVPPIVYDRLGKSIIDGNHRVEAAKMRGDKTILAYVGLRNNPNWQGDIEEDFNPKTDPTIMSATKKNGNISRAAADKMVDPRGNFAKPKYYYKESEELSNGNFYGYRIVSHSPNGGYRTLYGKEQIFPKVGKTSTFSGQGLFLGTSKKFCME